MPYGPTGSRGAAFSHTPNLQLPCLDKANMTMKKLTPLQIESRTTTLQIRLRLYQARLLCHVLKHGAKSPESLLRHANRVHKTLCELRALPLLSTWTRAALIVARKRVLV